MKLKPFIEWLEEVSHHSSKQKLSLFISWLSEVHSDPLGRNALQELEGFARLYSPNKTDHENPRRWGSQWLIFEALQGCMKSVKFQEMGDRHSNTRKVVADFKEDLVAMKAHLECALKILRRHDREKNPLLEAYIDDMWLSNRLSNNNVEIYEEAASVHPLWIEYEDDLGAEARKAITLKTGTIVRFFETFLKTLEMPVPRHHLGDFGSHQVSYGCLRFTTPRTTHHKKPTSVDTMLAAYLVTLFSYYRRGLPSPFSEWTPVELGSAGEHALAAGLINVTLPLKELKSTKNVKDNVRKLLVDNPGVSVSYWQLATYNPPKKV